VVETGDGLESAELDVGAPVPPEVASSTPLYAKPEMTHAPSANSQHAMYLASTILYHRRNQTARGRKPISLKLSDETQSAGTIPDPTRWKSMYPQPIASRLRPNGTPDSLTFPSMLAWM